MTGAMNVIDRAQATIRDHSLAFEDSPVLLMVSGGSDSTALAYIARTLSMRGIIGQIGILHVNHGLRGEDSDGDAAFVADLAHMLDVPFYLYNIEIGRIVHESGGNIEAVARRARYGAAFEALEKLCLYAGCPTSKARIFTAHTRNDRVENFYMRSIVGTGPGGFRSMLYSNGAVSRPLMDVEREELRELLNRLSIGSQEIADIDPLRDSEGNLWREDATNEQTDQFRGYVRHEIVPPALDRNPRLFEVLCRTMNLIAEEDDMLEEMARGIMDECVSWIDPEGDASQGCVVNPRFARHPKPLQRRAVNRILQMILGDDARIETRSIEAVIACFEDGLPVSGHTDNIQGDLALSVNKLGLRIEPMAEYRARRKML